MSAPAIVRPERQAWLAERRKGIQASDVAAILGVDPRRDALAVYAEKLGVQTPETPWMRRGRRLEAVVADEYHDETGRPVWDAGAHVIARHPEVPFLGATLDRTTDGTERHPGPLDIDTGEAPPPLECKAVAGPNAALWRRDVDEPPLAYQIQVQIQMACTGAAWGSLVALVSGLELVWFDLVRNDAFLARALPKLEEFWLRVQRRDPPPPGNLPSTRDVLRALYPTDDGSELQLDGDAAALVDRWLRAKDLKKDGADECEEAENQLRALIGDASSASLPDGSVLTLKTTARKGYVVADAQYRTLRLKRADAHRR